MVIQIDRKIHLSICHLCKFGVNVMDIGLQIPFGFVDRFHQHPDFGGIRFQRKLGPSPTRARG